MVEFLNGLIFLAIFGFFGWMCHRTYHARPPANQFAWATATVLCLFFFLYGPEKDVRKVYFWEDRASLDVGSHVMEVEQRDWGWVFARKDRGQRIPEGDVVVEEVRQPLAAIFLFGGVLFSVLGALRLTRVYPSRAERWAVRIRRAYRRQRDELLRHIAKRVEEAKED